MTSLGARKGHLTRSLKALEGALAGAEKALAASVHIDSSNPVTLRTAIREFTVLNCELSENLKRAEHKLESLYSFIDSLPKEEERKVAIESLQESEGLYASLLPPSERASREVSALLEMLKLDLQRPVDTAPARAPVVAAPPMAPPVRLPAVELPTFDGTLLDWPAFWSYYSDMVHNRQDVADSQKMMYLISCLRGSAKSALINLAPTASNYPSAIELLKQRFGGDEVVRTACHRALEDLPHISGNSIPKLRDFYDRLEGHFRSLISLGEDVDQPIYKSMLQRKLPYDIQSELYDKESSSEKTWSMTKWRTELGKILTKRETLLAFRSSTATKSQTAQDHGISNRSSKHQQSFESPKFTSTPQRSTAEGLVASERRFPCIFCSGEHWAVDCDKYTTAQERESQIHNRCFLCFKEGHQKVDCMRKNKTCPFCKATGEHHRSLCPIRFPTRQTTRQTFARNDSQVTGRRRPASDNLAAAMESISLQDDADKHPALPNVQTQESSYLVAGERVLMQTAMATVRNKDHSCQTRIFFDTGSTRTWCSEELAKKLNLTRGPVETIEMATFGSNRRLVKSQRSTFDLVLHDDALTISVNIVPRMVDTLMRAAITEEESELVRLHSPLADNILATDEAVPVDLLIGNDYYMDLLNGERRMVSPGLYLLGSRLGWVLTGRSQARSTCDTSLFTIGCCLTHGDVPALGMDSTSELQMAILEPKPDLDSLWNLETIGIRDSAIESDDDQAIKAFNRTIQQHEGRYSVTFPWKQEHMLPHENFTLASRRLDALLKSLTKQPERLQKYDTILKEQEKLGVIERVTDQHAPVKKVHYLPHHAVTRSDSETTKLRIVYDGSAKARQDALSLNDCLHRGPVILENLVSLLMKFRLNSVGVIADIEKAFLQVEIQPVDRDVTRFLWLKDPTQPHTEDNLRIYRFCRVPFGLVCSPFLLSATVKYHLQSSGCPAAHLLKEHIYVDNVVLSLNSVAEAVSLYNDAKDVFQKAYMNLREWNSNSKEFKSTIAAQDQSDHHSVLGLTWDTDPDTLAIPSKISTHDQSSTIFRRDVLSVIASVYDPLGLFGPVLLKAKLFCQFLWEENLAWKDPLTEAHLHTWLPILEDISLISERPVPRRVCFGTAAGVEHDLVCFCDSSEKAFATVAYLRQTYLEEVKVDLIFSKTRLAPLKKRITIPRLELMAALIGVRAIQFVKSSLQLKFNSVTLWSDSQCVLHWLSTSRPLTVFVENRLREITSHKDVTFRYIQTTENPADIPTRGASIPELMESPLWWKGPPWLLDHSDKWPLWNSEPVALQQQCIQSEMKRPKRSTQLTDAILTASEGSPQSELLGVGTIDMTKFSSLKKLLRVTAWILRFIHRARKNNNIGDQQPHGELTHAELENAELLWLKAVQRHHYPELLDNSTKLPARHHLVKKLGIKRDTAGLLRCHGRIGHSHLSQAAKTPVLLPRGCYFTTLVILAVHERIKHFGVSFTLAEVRNTFWIPKGRAEVAHVLKECRKCRKLEGGPYQLPDVPSLPPARVTPSVPFTNIGLDYLGPLYVKDKAKVWICLFTCLSTRAVHLEVVESLSAAQFLLGLRRFIARRGRPISITLDNATQFKLGKETVDKAWIEAVTDPEIEKFSAGEQITWRFIPEYAPWFGGFYERLVGLTKRALKKSLGRSAVSIGELTTLVAEVEGILNQRPLTVTTEDINSHVVLTPAHLLGPRSGSRMLPVMATDNADPDYHGPLDSAEQLLEVWKDMQAYLQKFWDIWYDEYLLSLRERYVTLHQTRSTSEFEPQVGDVVLIKAPTPRLTWKMGRVVSLQESRDGKVRSAMVQVARGSTVKRSLAHLYPLESSRNEPTETDKQKSQDLPRQLQPIPVRAVRAAAAQARRRIHELAHDLG